KWPHAFPELQREHPVVLASAPHSPSLGIEMHLRRAPVRAASDEVAAARVVRPRAHRGRTGRIEVRDLFGSNGIADVENPYPRIEEPARERSGVVPVVHAAVVAAIGKYGEAN